MPVIYVTCNGCGYYGHISTWTIIRADNRTAVVSCPECRATRSVVI